jgi:hypothetical protein
MKEYFAYFSTILIVVYIFISISFVFNGCSDQVSLHDVGCDRPRNYTTIFPSYKIGCWLGDYKK